MDWLGEVTAVGLSEEMRSVVLDNLSEGVYFVDRERRILYWNHGAEGLTGYSASDVVGRFCHDNILSHCNGAGTILCGSRCPLRATIRDGKPRVARLFLRHKDGHRQPTCVRAVAIRDPAGKIVGAVETFHDDSSLFNSRRRAADLERAAMTDALTGVGNRRFGEMLLETWIEQHRRFERLFGVLLVDLDQFKRVNDRYGHQAGDGALRAVARTLRHASRIQDEVIRWGGDEFVVLLADANVASLTEVAQRLRMLVRRTSVRGTDDRALALNVSIGGTIVAIDDTAGTIVRRADALLYRSKAGGRNRVTVDVG